VAQSSLAHNDIAVLTTPPQATVELAVLDGPILARGVLTLLLLHLADAGAFDPVWSDQIHAEWMRDVQRVRPDLSVERVRQRRLELNRAFPVANVIVSRDAQDEVLAHCTTLSERRSAHVLATALSARAAVIVTDDTFCLTDVMSKLWHDTAVLSADAWLLELLDRQPAAVLTGARTHRASLSEGGPEVTVELWLAMLREPHVGLPRTADRLAQMAEKF
jgi:predicted nucleic acid-binding protein